MLETQEYLDILRKINDRSNITQRSLSKALGISLGKLNYCINSLKKKGILKIKNFKNNKNKFNINSKNNYFYILTPKGITLKTRLTVNFMKKKMHEYDELKHELLKNNKTKKILDKQLL